MACPFCKEDHNWPIEEALDRLAKGPAVIRDAVRGASAKELTWSEDPKRWSPAEVVVHLLDTELIYSVRARKILSEDNGELPAFDQNLWASACTNGRDVDRVLQTFELLRADNISLFRASLDKMDRTGNHPEYGKLSLRDLLVHLSPHDQKHAGQIKKTREKYRDITL